MKTTRKIKISKGYLHDILRTSIDAIDKSEFVTNITYNYNDESYTIDVVAAVLDDGEEKPQKEPSTFVKDLAAAVHPEEL